MTEKKITAAELKEKGYLQEANRMFFHPLGLAMGVDSETNTIVVYDYREDAEGVYYNLCAEEESSERLLRFNRNADFIREEMESRREIRQAIVGSVIEIIPYTTDPEIIKKIIN